MVNRNEPTELHYKHLSKVDLQGIAVLERLIQQQRRIEQQQSMGKEEDEFICLLEFYLNLRITSIQSTFQAKNLHNIETMSQLNQR